MLYPWTPRFQEKFAGRAISPAWERGKFDAALSRFGWPLDFQRDEGLGSCSWRQSSFYASCRGAARCCARAVPRLKASIASGNNLLSDL